MQYKDAKGKAVYDVVVWGVRLQTCMQVHHFQDIGYRHNSMKHCPAVHRNR